MKIWDRFSDPKEEEVWVELYGGRYAISSQGNLKSRTRSVEWLDMQPIKMASGYFSVGIYPNKGDDPTTFLIHRLVAESFYGPAPEGKSDVRHLDGVKSNNSLVNLAWGSRSENMLDVVRHREEGKKETNDSDNFGSSCTKWYQGKTLDDHLIRVGCEFYSEGLLTIKHLARLWACSDDVASAILHKESRLHVQRDEIPKQKRRTNARKLEIRSLVAEGKTLREINQLLDETLTAQDLYYYKSKVL